MSQPISVLYHANGLLAINKPPSLSVHAAPGPGGSVLRELIAQTGLRELTPVHRLDKDASGVLLLAESKALAAELQRDWARAEKTYWALCDGVPAQTSGVIDARILEHQTGKPERLRNAVRYFQKQNPGAELPPLPAPKTSAIHPAGRASQTRYKVVEAFEHFSLIEARPLQGRMHQIRVHLAYLGHPLAVDPLYRMRAILIKGDAVLLTRMPLHAARLQFEFRKETIAIEAPMAEDMRAAVEFLRGGIRRA
ncbi:MAG TPA: pseudouridine synthase [Planctomycetota bacterium]|nr:pseudouridine synthase [Planctomycetota bacterium]